MSTSLATVMGSPQEPIASLALVCQLDLQEQVLVLCRYLGVDLGTIQKPSGQFPIIKPMFHKRAYVASQLVSLFPFRQTCPLHILSLHLPVLTLCLNLFTHTIILLCFLLPTVSPFLRQPHPSHSLHCSKLAQIALISQLYHVVES